MSTVKSVIGMKEESGIQKYKCLMINDSYKWLEKHKIANFNGIPNKYADKSDLSDSTIKKTKAETKALAEVTMKKTGVPGLKKY